MVRSRWASSLIDCRAYNGVQTGSEHGSDQAMFRARLRLRMKAACIPNRPFKFDTAKLKSAALEHLRQDLRNRFEGLQLDEDARKLCRWEEHFKELLNHATSPNTTTYLRGGNR